MLYVFLQHHIKFLHCCVVQFEHVFELVGHNSFYVIIKNCDSSTQRTSCEHFTWHETCLPNWKLCMTVQLNVHSAKIYFMQCKLRHAQYIAIQGPWPIKNYDSPTECTYWKNFCRCETRLPDNQKLGLPNWTYILRTFYAMQNVTCLAIGPLADYSLGNQLADAQALLQYYGPFSTSFFKKWFDLILVELKKIWLFCSIHWHVNRNQIFLSLFFCWIFQ